ncbi:hypothetical protein [Albidovulum sp.]|uniref:hypothetical protein n=1 Tax=Albidovulum sp. TaxID=1872424 RepID=UPI001DE3D598|nr:hypothetical protein [Paracoccaceae bacterium]
MELVLHIGVHRTGTTALQHLLQAHQALLARRRVSFWGPAILRLDGPQRYWRDCRAGAGDHMATARAADTRATFHQEIVYEQENDRRLVVVSEENFLGTIEANFAEHRLYPAARERLETYATLFPEPPARVYVAVRDYGDYWSSAQALQLRFRAGLPFDSDKLVAGSAARGWPEVLADVAAALPHSRIRTWRYTGRSGMVRGALADMIGRRLARWLPDAKIANVSLSVAALEELGRRRAAGEVSSDAELAAAVAELREEGGPKLRLFSDTQRAALSELFDKEWQLIAGGGIPRVEAFDPEAHFAVTP